MPAERDEIYVSTDVWTDDPIPASRRDVMRFMDLLRWETPLGRGPYFLIGSLLFALKHNLDRLVATLLFDRPWSLFNYVTQAVPSSGASAQELATFYGTLAALSVPFIALGVLFTSKRLRAANLPAWLVVLFFVPFVNLLFFLVLAVVPSASAGAGGGRGPGYGANSLHRIMPADTPGSAAMAIGLSLPPAVALASLGTLALGTYGWGLFLGLPFCTALAAVLLFAVRGRRELGPSLLVGLAAVGALGAALGVIALEGLICLIMAAPIGLALGLLGALLGWALQREAHGQAPPVLATLALALPALMGAEWAGQAPPALLAVRTSVEVDVSADRVWPHVVAFTELPPPTEAIFRLGVAYPIRAEIHGRGAGALRLCRFSTGVFVEPIDVWDEPRRLAFSVAANPAPMQEWTPYARVHPPHLDGYLQSRRGEFLLEPLPGGRTRVTGTTWYEHRMWPATYWQLWSDAIIHRIHLRVLRHVKAQAEGAA